MKFVRDDLIINKSKYKKKKKKEAEEYISGVGKRGEEEGQPQQEEDCQRHI